LMSDSKQRLPARCCNAPRKERKAPAGITDPNISRLVLMNSTKWLNGQHLFYTFLKKPRSVSARFWLDDERNKNLVRAAFKDWNAVVGIQFEETNDVKKAQIRIGFLVHPSLGGYWSFIGREILTATDTYNRTMNYGYNLYEDPRDKGVALHEIGHTLDFPHEHQNPNAHFVWDQDAVIQAFGAPPNSWPPEVIEANVTGPITGDYEASPFDDQSIMGYDIEPGLIKSPPKYYQEGLKPSSRLSKQDIEWAQHWYPLLTDSKILSLEEGKLLSVPPKGQDTEISFIPSESGTYGIQVVGDADTFFLLQDGPTVLKGRDTEGGVKAAKIVYDLEKGKKYTVRVRVNALTSVKNAVYVVAFPTAASKL